MCWCPPGRDCSDIKEHLASVVPKIPSGIYIVHPEDTDASFEVAVRSSRSGAPLTPVNPSRVLRGFL